MKRAIYLPIGLAIILATAPAAAAAPVQTFTAKASNSTAGAPSDLTLSGETSMPDGSKPPGVKSISIDGPAGANVNFNVASACDRDQLQTDGKCPPSSQLSKSGSAVARVDFGGLASLSIGGIKVYRGKNCAGGTVGCAYIYAAEPTTGVTTIIDAQVQKNGSVPQISIPNATLPMVLGVEPVLSSLSFKIGKKSGKKSLYTNPKKCPASGWTSTLNINYADGSTSQVESTQKCKSAKKKH